MNLKKLKRYIKIPHTFVLIFMITIFMALLTWVIPAGEFDRTVDPATGSWRLLEVTIR